MKRISSFRGQAAHARVIIQSSADMIERIRVGGDLDPSDNLMLTECESWLCAASKSLYPPLWWIYRSYLAFDGVWLSLAQVRHRLCILASQYDLIHIAMHIQKDIEDIKGVGRDKNIATLETIIENITKNKHDEQELLEYRRDLYRLSLTAAEDRQKTWHLVNLIRERLHITAVWLLGMLAVSTVILP